MDLKLHKLYLKPLINNFKKFLKIFQREKMIKVSGVQQNVQYILDKY